VIVSRARTHLLLTYLLTAPFLGVQNALLATFGALLPDADHPRSVILSPLSLLETVIRKPVRARLGELLKHRGPLHCPWLWLALVLTLHASGKRVPAYFALGGLLHVLQDALTTMGIPVWWRRDGRAVFLALTDVPADRWDRFLLPACLAVSWALFLLNPGELYSTHPQPVVEDFYWWTRSELFRPFLHSNSALTQESVRLQRYGRLPHVRARLHYADGDRIVSGFWTPVGWIRGDDGRWHPPPDRGYSLLNLEYRRAWCTTRVVHSWPVDGRALVLDALLEYRGLDHRRLEGLVGRAIVRGFKVRHVDRTSGRLLLEGHGLSGLRLPRPKWMRARVILVRA
jgi:inner membrane protein